MNIILGVEVEDMVTGFRGVTTGRVEYLTGCAQYLVQPRADEKGEMRDARWLDETRINLVPGGFAVALPERTDKGADIPAPIR